MSSGTRLVSLDVFRGLTMAAMVVVNNPGDWSNVYWPLLHAEWHGWTPTDLVFPFFLFIVGVSITLSQKSVSWGSILRRAALILALGLFLAGYPHFDLSRWRIPGVLQRIALCYLAAAGIYRLTGGAPCTSPGDRLTGGAPCTPSGYSLAGGASRGRQARVIAALALVLALGYWGVITFVPPPGGVPGDLTPEGNIGAWIDRALMAGHLWKPRWDPEGLLSTLPAISTTLLGVLAGMWLSSSRTAERKAALLTAGGAVAMAVGLAWGVVFPINKALWTSSYAVFSGGFASLLLAACYWAIDIRGWKAWAKPLVVLGSNAITLFMASGLLVKTLALIRVAGPDGRDISVSRWVYLHAFLPIASPKNASLLYALANLLLLYALLAWMYRRRLFLRV